MHYRRQAHRDINLKLHKLTTFADSILDQSIEELCYNSRYVDALQGKFGTAINFSQFEPDGTLKFNGLATVYDDLRIDLSNIKAPTLNPPTWTSYKGGECPIFSATQSEILYFRIQLPHGWKEGSDLNFHIHVTYPTNGTGNSQWKFTYSWANIDGTFPTETTLLQTFAAPTITDQHIIHSFGTISGTDKNISSILICSLSRLGTDVLDTYASGIYGISADFHYQIDTIGSRQEYIK